MTLFGQPSVPVLYERNVAARRTVFRKGEAVQGIPVIRTGWAAVIGAVNSHRRQIIDFLLPDDPVSSSLVFAESLPFAVEAITDVTYQSFNRQVFDADLRHKAGVLEQVFKRMSQENLQLAQLANSLAFGSAEERIGRLIMLLGERLAQRGLAGNNTFDFPLRQQHIAEYTGLTTVHVSNVLGQLRRQGLIEIKDRALTVRDPATLRRLCETWT